MDDIKVRWKRGRNRWRTATWYNVIMCFAACRAAVYKIPSEFVTLSIVTTMGHFYLVREISMGTGARRVALLSFVIDIYHGIVVLLLSPRTRLRTRRLLSSLLLLLFIFFSTPFARDLCRSVNSVRASMSSPCSCSDITTLQLSYNNAPLERPAGDRFGGGERR